MQRKLLGGKTLGQCGGHWQRVREFCRLGCEHRGG